MEYVLALIIGLSTGFVESLLFLIFLTKIKPKIAISSQIAKGKSTTGKTVYRIKVINKTNRDIVGIKARLHLFTPVKIRGGTIYKSKEILLKRKELLILEKFDEENKQAGYAYRFLTYENIESLWKNESFLRFRIYAINSFSGFGKVFTKDYLTKMEIKNGDFVYGDSLKIT